MAGFLEAIIALIVGKGREETLAVGLSICAEYGLDLAERHRRWLVKRETDEIRSQCSNRPMPTTLHAAMHQRSMGWESQPPISCSMPSSGAWATTVPSPSTEARFLMPNRHFLNVHSHYATFSDDVAPNFIESSEVMQTYDFGQIDTGHRIGFNPHRRHKRISRPPRRNIDLERLPPLGPKLIEEIEKKKQLLEQAAIYAQIREKKEAETERKRRTSTAQQHPMPPFVLRIDKWYTSSDTSLQDPLVSQATRPASLQCRCQSLVSQSEAAQEAVGCFASQTRGRLTSNLIQQRQKKFQDPRA